MGYSRPRADGRCTSATSVSPQAVPINRIDAASNLIAAFIGSIIHAGWLKASQRSFDFGIGYNPPGPIKNCKRKSDMQEYIYGLAPVLEALRSRRRPITRILLATGASPSRLSELTDAARREKITIERRDRRDLDGLTQHANHQGIVAVLGQTASRKAYTDPDEILDSCRKPGLVVLLDNIEDPHNLGAILRTCEASGVDGVFIPDRRAAPLNETVSKTSAGAVEYVRVAEVTNLVPLIENLKQRGFWVAGLEGDGTTVYTDYDMTSPMALVFGSEGKGLRRLVRDSCDVVLSIPMSGKMNSLNVSVAAGVVLFEVMRQRRGT